MQLKQVEKDKYGSACQGAGQKQKNQEFKVTLSYIVNSQPAWTLWEPKKKRMKERSLDMEDGLSPKEEV